MKIIKATGIILGILSALFSHLTLSFSQDILEAVPGLRYADPNSSILILLDWNELRKKGLSWDAIKVLAGSNTIIKGLKFTNEDLLEKAFDDPSEIGIPYSSRVIIFTMMTNQDQTGLSGIIITLEDQAKFTDFIEKVTGPDKAEIKKANNFNYMPSGDKVLIGWDTGAFILLFTDYKNKDLFSEMNNLFSNKVEEKEFGKSSALINIVEKSNDISIWLPLNKILTNPSLKQPFDKIATNPADKLELTIRAEFLTGQFTADLDLYGLSSYYSQRGLSITRKIDPSIFKMPPAGNIIGFIAISFDMKEIHDHWKDTSRYIKDLNPEPSFANLDTTLSSYGLTGEDITDAFSGDFIIFLTDNGRTDGDLEIGLAANIKNMAKMNSLLTRLEKSKNIKRDLKNRNIYIIGKPKIHQTDSDSGRDQDNDVIYMLIKDDKLYLAAKPLKDTLMSSKGQTEILKSELNGITDTNFMAGYIDVASFINIMKANKEGEGALAALIGNFLKDVKMTAVEKSPDSANLHLEFRIQNQLESSLEVILKRIIAMLGESDSN
jgi:hypothetical protein